MKRILLSFAIAVFATFTLSAQFSASSLVFYYPFNENTDDASTNSFGLTQDLGGEPTYVDGKFGKAISLNGQRYITGETPIDMFDSHTFVTWLKIETPPPTATNSSFTLIHHSTTGRVHLAISGSVSARGNTYTNAINCVTGGLTGGTAPDERTVDPNPVQLNTWYHVATVLDRQNLLKKLYVNGVEVDNVPLTSVELSNKIPIAIGANRLKANPFIGIVDEMALFNRALSAAEIQGIMNNGISIVTSVKETKAELEMKVYPNPSNGVFQLSTAAANVQYKLVDLVGKELLSGTFSNTFNLNVSQLPKGAYLLNYNADGKQGIQKLMIK